MRLLRDEKGDFRQGAGSSAGARATPVGYPADPFGATDRSNPLAAALGRTRLSALDG